jgi:hypothetical protein
MSDDAERRHCEPREAIQFDGTKPGVPRRFAFRSNERPSVNQNFGLAESRFCWRRRIPSTAAEQSGQTLGTQFAKYEPQYATDEDSRSPFNLLYANQLGALPIVRHNVQLTLVQIMLLVLISFVNHARRLCEVDFDQVFVRAELRL